MGFRILILAFVGWIGLGAGVAQTGPAKAPAVKSSHKERAAKAPMAVWSQDVTHAFGILPSQFAGSGLTKLTQAQLDALLQGALKPKGTMIACPVPSQGGNEVAKTRVLLTVSGADATDAISSEIKAAVGGLSDVRLVDGLGQADASLRVVVQALTVNQKIIGYTASYVLGTPCTESVGEKKTQVELKGVLGSMMNAKSAGMAQSLATTFDKELAAARRASASK